ncbi:hypothetical protein GCM10011512_25270 [Tersicoccus solisilvae]|uniref:DUF2087 domain-containing protein n=1 Tax=Tersicoccus solisilvae TaxID=1882339 RepID=A0ABQ1PI02_9MICC|nr:DUF2087 domain-containing protein [Tersicoccus solisilvae]GGC97200.1 hypothetical protein GCM10011512_25270 [Tersicoccus solisilvae]
MVTSPRNDREPVPWQRVFAALANDKLRLAYGRAVVHGVDRLDERETRKLTDAGLLATDPRGAVVVDGSVFRAALAASAVPQPTGVDRFFREGRITAVPRRTEDRDELLGHLAIRLFGVEDVLTEAEVNRLLATVTRDVPSLRRALVDFGFLTRETDGSLYWRSA